MLPQKDDNVRLLFLPSFFKRCFFLPMRKNLAGETGILS